MPRLNMPVTKARLQPQLRTLAMLDINQVSSLFGVCPETINGWISKGDFPEPLRFNARCRRWRLVDVETYLNRIQARNTQ